MFPSSSKIKVNAAGMSPESSMLLPERSPEGQEEKMLLDCLTQIYSPSSTSIEDTLEHFSSDILYISPKGEVLVGHRGLARVIESNSNLSERFITHRLLATPEGLPTGSLVVDQVITQKAERGGDVLKRSLIVLKRRGEDGLIISLTEEENHRKATNPLSSLPLSSKVSNFHSPTDAMLSPCTSKLNLVKKKHHQKARPLNLFASTGNHPTSSASVKHLTTSANRSLGMAMAMRGQGMQMED